MNSFFYDSFRLFLLFLIPGFFLGILYDFFRILRISRTADIVIKGGFFEKIRPQQQFFKRNGKNRVVLSHNFFVFVEDILFWILAAVVEILFLFYTNNGEIRIYCLLFSVFGFSIYHFSIGRLIVSFAKQIIFCVRCLIYWIGYAILYPLKAIWLRVRALCISIFRPRILILKQRKTRRYSRVRQKEILEAARIGFEGYF